MITVTIKLLLFYFNFNEKLHYTQINVQSSTAVNHSKEIKR